MISIDLKEVFLQGQKGIEWDTLYFQYFSLGINNKVDPMFELISNRVNRLASTIDQASLPDLINFTDTLIENYFDASWIRKDAIHTSLKWENDKDVPEFLRTSRHLLGELYGITEHEISEIVNSKYIPASEKYLKLYHYEVAQYLGMLEDTNIEILSEGQFSRADILTLITANVLGEQTYKSDNIDRTEAQALAFVTLSKTADSNNVLHIPADAIDNTTAEIHRMLQQQKRDDATLRDRRHTAIQIELPVLYELIGLAEQASTNLTSPLDTQLAAESLISFKNKLAVNKRHAPARKIKERFIKYFYDKNSKNKISKSAAAQKFYKSLPSAEQLIITPSKIEKNAIRTLTDALREFEKRE